jgi:DNA-binding transcriptional ArsR family regulator
VSALAPGVREARRAATLAALEGRELTRRELAAETDMNDSVMSNLLTQLRDEGTIDWRAVGGGGQRVMLYRLAGAPVVDPRPTDATWSPDKQVGRPRKVPSAPRAPGAGRCGGCGVSHKPDAQCFVVSANRGAA